MAADLQLSSENPYTRRTTRNSKEGDNANANKTPDEEKCTCSHSGEAEIRACTKPCCKNIGHEILKKQGWKAGRGLGKSLQGPLDAPPLKKVITTLGANDSVGDVCESTTEKRRLLECERETTEELASKYEENAEKEKAREASLATLKASFYCEPCDRQYLQHGDFDNHINSYDHAHVKRLKELKQQQIRAQLSNMRLRDDKIKEKDLKRITEFAQARVERDCDDGAGKVDADCTTVFYDNDTPDMPPLPQGVNIMDTVCPDTIPLPPDPSKVAAKSDSSDPENSPSKDNTAELSGHSTISFALKGKQSSALPGQSIFKEEEEANRRKLNFPRKKKIPPKKQPALSFVPKSDDKEKTEVKQAAEKEAEELYPSQPLAEDVRPKPHFKKMMFVQSAENLGGSKAEVKQEVIGPVNKPDLLHFVKVTRLEDDGQLDWPAEMVQTTQTTSPAVVFSCNPLKFDFGLLIGKPKPKPATEKTEKKDKKKKKSKKRKNKSRSRSSKRNEEKDDKGEEKGGAETKSDKTKSNKKKSKKKSKKKKSKKAETDSESGEEKKAAEDGTAKPENQKTSKKTKKHRKKSSKRSKKINKKQRESESESEAESEHEKNTSKENIGAKPKPETPKKTKRLVKKKKKVEDSCESEDSDGEEEQKASKKQYRKRTNSATQPSSDGDPKAGAKKKKVKKKGPPRVTVPTKAEATAANRGAQKRGGGTAAVGGKKRVKVELEDGGRVSDFEGAKDKGQSKWETSSDSALENLVKTETKIKKTVKTKKSNNAKTAASKKPVKQNEDGSRRARRDSELSERRSSRRSHHSSSSRDRSRSYSDDSYYTYSSRSRSDSRDSRYYTSSDYYTDYSSRSRSRSRSYRSRSRGRRHHSDSYSSSSRSRSRSRSYSRDRRSRSYSRRRRSYSRSSRSYTRSRSRHRTRSRSRRRQLQPSPDPRFSSLKRPQNNKLRRQLSKKPFKPGPVRAMGVNGEIPALLDKIIPKPGEKPTSQTGETSQSGQSTDSSAVPTISAKKVNMLEGDRPRPEMSEEEKKKREKLIQDIAARMEKEAEEAEKAIKDKVASVTKPESIPIPAPHNSQTIPLPSKPAVKTPPAAKVNKAGTGGIFIGPVQPGTSNIPLPSTDKFQHIGPDDPLVFKKPLSSGDGGEETNKTSSAPASEEKANSSSFMIPPEQAEKYKALQDQVRKHLARQRGELVESSEDEEEVTPAAENGDSHEEAATAEMVSPGLEDAQLLAQLTPQLVPLTPGVIAGMPLQAGAPVMISTSHAAQAVALAQAQQAQAIQQAQLLQAAQVQAVAAQQQAQAQMAAQIQNQQALALAQGQVFVQQQVGQGALVQTPQGLVRVPTAVQPQVISGAQLQQLQLQRAMAAQQQQSAVLMRGATPMLVRLPVHRPM